MRSKKGQSAFEYLFTYGWAILAAIIAIGALSYFGFISPSNMMPNRCNFGRQLECAEYNIMIDDSIDPATAVVYLRFRNNFGKPIQILDIQMIEDPAGVVGPHPFASITKIPAGGTGEFKLQLINTYKKVPGDKQGLNFIVNFTRADIAGAPSHTVIGYVFTTVAE